MDGISKETFNSAEADVKLNILFDFLTEIHSQQKKQFEAGDKRLQALEKQKLKFYSIAGIGGIIGGFIAVMTKKIMGL